MNIEQKELISLREPYQILVFPYLKTAEEKVRYCIFKRKDLEVWQGIAGGGENGESPIKAAKRETFEEAGIAIKNKFTRLSSISSIPVEAISGFIWGKDTLVIPEYSFGVEVHNMNIYLEDEHTTYEWLNYEEAVNKLEWDSNKTALWELNYRLTNNLLNNIKNVI